jgi:ABC-2 type transport system permease protein
VSGDGLTGTAALTRLALRRDRVRLPVWAGCVALFALYAVVAFGAVYPTAADRQVRASLLESPAAKMLSGPGYGLDDYTLGAMIANEMALWLMLPAAAMSIFLVVRHTRAEEETGRAELLRAAAVGRTAPLLAGLLAAAVANAVVTALVAVVLVGGGLAVADSLALALGVGLTGLVFAAVAAVTSQLTEHARTASGSAMAVLGAALLVRALGDVRQPGGSALSWLSPLAWPQQTRPYVDLRWTPLLLSVALALAAALAAYALSGRRDLGAGILPARAGRPEAPRSLSSPLGLALRQQRRSVLGWAVALFVMALATGSMTDAVTDVISELPPEVAALLTAAGQDPARGFYATNLLLLALAVGGFAAASVLRLRAEERTGHAETLLAAPVSRWRWLAGTLLVSAGGSAVLLAVSGLGMGLGARVTTGDGGDLVPLVAASLSYLPAVLVVAGLTALLYAARPDAASLAWVLVGYAVFVGMFAPLLQLPERVSALSPFGHTPLLPQADAELVPLAVLAAVAAGLVALAAAAFGSRDVRTG